MGKAYALMTEIGRQSKCSKRLHGAKKPAIRPHNQDREREESQGLIGATSDGRARLCFEGGQFKTEGARGNRQLLVLHLDEEIANRSDGPPIAVLDGLVNKRPVI